jgi:hypothetical protein
MEKRVSVDMVGTIMLKFFDSGCGAANLGCSRLSSRLFRLRLCRAVTLFCSVAGIAGATEFSIQIAGPVAAQTYKMKSSAFVFRALGCDAPAMPEVTATAEGLVAGQRRSMPLKVSPAQTPGVFGIFRQWPEEGVWIVSLAGSCSSKSASVLVATDGKGFVRESSVFFARPATESDIEAALKTARKKPDASND